MTKAEKLFRYQGCGLDYVYLRNGYHKHPTKYGVGYSIDNVDELHQLIARMIVLSPDDLTGQEVRFLRGMLDWSQTDLGIYLGSDRQIIGKIEKKPHDPIDRARSIAIKSHYVHHVMGSANAKEVTKKLDEHHKNQQHKKIEFEDRNNGWSVAA